MNSPSVEVPWAAAAYVGVVQGGAYVTGRMSERRREALLRGQSTNVENLRAGRWHTLVTSALLVTRPVPLPYGAALLGALGTAEVLWGPRRAAAVFAAGHIGASLLVYGGLRAAAARRTPLAPETERAVDVGASYGFNAVLGALAVSVPHRRARTAATAGLLALGVRPLLRKERTFTDAGHLAAIGVGVATGLLRPGRKHGKGDMRRK